MITPIFKLDQDQDYLYISIKAPYAKLNDIDLFVEDNDFRFYCKPYYLRLNLPDNILDNENGNGTYDFDQNSFKFKFEKAEKGKRFEGLDLITKMLTPNTAASKGAASRPLIEELDADDQAEDDEEDGDIWFVEQKQEDESDPTSCSLADSSIKYGFAQTKSDIFSKLGSEYGLIIDLPEPESTPLSERAVLREAHEEEKFDDDHYLADTYGNDELIQTLLDYEPEEEDDEDYTEEEIDCLKSKLPKRTYLLDKQQKMFAYCGLVDILFAYMYNRRVNTGEENSESGWNISKLSSTLCWLDAFSSVESVVRASFRRSLCYPLYRNWKLSQKVYQDMVKLLKQGRKKIIKTMLEIRTLFIDGDCRYILNDLYINDYCVWLQYVKEKKLAELAECLEGLEVSKEMVNLDLDVLELSGKLALEDQLNDPEQTDSDSSDD